MISIMLASLCVATVVPLVGLAWAWLSGPVPREDHAFRPGPPPVPVTARPPARIPSDIAPASSIA